MLFIDYYHIVENDSQPREIIDNEDDHEDEKNEVIERLSTEEDPQSDEEIQGLDSEEETQGLDSDEEIQGLDSEEETQGLDSEEETQGLDSDEEIQGLDSDEETQGLDSEEDIQGLDSEEETQGLDSEEETQGLDSDEEIQGLNSEEEIQGLNSEDIQALDSEEEIQALDSEEEVEEDIERLNTEEIKDPQYEMEVKGLDRKEEMEGLQRDKMIQRINRQEIERPDTNGAINEDEPNRGKELRGSYTVSKQTVHDAKSEGREGPAKENVKDGSDGGLRFSQSSRKRIRKDVNQKTTPQKKLKMRLLQNR